MGRLAQTEGLTDVQQEILAAVHAPHPKLFDQMLSGKTQALLGCYETV